MKKRFFLYLSIMSLLLLGPLSASLGKQPPPPDPNPMNCETPPFINLNAAPNVLIILDNSGSMLQEDAGSPYDPGKTYKPWAGLSSKGSNYDDWWWFNRNRWQIVKNVITHLVDETEGFRFGLMRLDGYGRGGYMDSDWGIPDPSEVPYWIAPYDEDDPDPSPDGPPPDQIFSKDDGDERQGGKLLQPCGPDRQGVIDYINGMEPEKTVPGTWTNLAETLYTGGQYFAEGHGPSGMGLYKDSPETNWEYGGGYWAKDTDDYGNTIDISSPIQGWCQKNFIILLTDGEANYDSDWPQLTSVVGDYDGDGEDTPYDPNNNPDPSNRYLDDVAKFLYDKDMRDDIDGVQNIITYTVSFAIQDEGTKDLLRSAAEKGGGIYFDAGDYDQLKDAFGKIVNDIVQRIASGTAVAVQSTSTQGTRRLLRAKFIPGEWTGHLEAFRLPYTQGDVPLWDAGIVLKNTNPDARYIFTAVDDKNGVQVEMKRKLLFTEANSGTEDANNDTLTTLLGAADDAEAKNIISYIRGKSVAGYRTRSDGWKLGDIAYSSPVIFEDIAYVGANDGMLHAFDINNGQELWAFIPNNILGKLEHLTRVDYCHEYFVDLSAKVVNMNGKKVLIGGERGGGNAFFALDITTAKDPATVQPLWEFSDPNLGESWTVPTIEKVWIGGGPRWVAFIGSAFDNQDSKGYLFAVDMDTGEKIGTELNLTGKPDNSLPSLRAIDFDQDGYTDRIYVGCLAEKLFVVEIGPEADPSAWKNDQVFTTNPGQPISIPTSLSLYRVGGQDYVGIYMGTGKYYDLADKDDKTVQSFYAIIDNEVKRGGGGLSDQTDPSTCKPIVPNWGWKIDFVDNPGERVVSSALVLGGYVFFTTFQPDDDPCKAGGIARLYVVNYDNGCVPAAAVVDINGDGAVDSGDTVDGTVPPRSIEIGYGIPSDIIFDPTDSTIIIQTSDTTIHVFNVNVGSEKLTVHSWREVIN